MASTGTNRRGFLGSVTSLLMAAIGLIVGIPALGYFLSPLRRKSDVEGAGATFQVGMATGKFQGVMSATTPTGTCSA